MGRWGDRETRRWGDRETRRWGDREKLLISISIKTSELLLSSRTSINLTV
ncbi:MAG: hypothetical protein F6K36_25785 [Symploca sp. SIO3C6]|nr:hypothetical protein [Symploca sp. SIO3C6]